MDDDSMSAADELAQRLILLSALEKRVADLRAATKRELHEHISPGTTLKPVLADGSSVGRVSYTVNRTTASVSDAELWGDWAAKHYPDAVELAYVVKPWLTAQALRLSQEAGIPLGPGGEVGPDGPRGIAVKESGGYISATPDHARAIELWAEIRDRMPELTGTDYPEIGEE